MKKLLYIIFLVVIFCSCAYAQRVSVQDTLVTWTKSGIRYLHLKDTVVIYGDLYPSANHGWNIGSDGSRFRKAFFDSVMSGKWRGDAIEDAYISSAATWDAARDTGIAHKTDITELWARTKIDSSHYSDTAEYSRNAIGIGAALVDADFSSNGIMKRTSEGVYGIVTDNSTTWNTALVPGAIGTTVQAYDADLTTYAGITPLANTQSFLAAADYAAMRTLLGLVISTNVQAYDADLTIYAGITPLSNTQSFLGAADYAAMKILLGLTIGTNVQAYDADLTTYAGITPSSNVQTLLGSADYAAFKTSLSLNNIDNTSDANKPISSATQSALDLKLASARRATFSLTGETAFNDSMRFIQGENTTLTRSGNTITIASSGTGGGAVDSGNFAKKNANLSDLTSFSTARTNLGLVIGTNVQAYDADLTTWAGITPSVNMQEYLTAGNYAAMKTFLNLTIGTNVQAYDADLTTYAGITPSASVQTYLQSADYAAMRVLLGLTIGTNVQAYDADLTTYAGITPSSNVQSYLGAADYAAMKVLLGLTIGTNVQAYDADLTTYAGITPSANVQTLLGSADYAAYRSNLSLTIGTNVQAYDADLTTYAGITPSANVQSLLGAADYAAILVLLSLNNVNNTSDANKPISTATQTALDLKANAGDLNARKMPPFPNNTNLWARGDSTWASIPGSQNASKIFYVSPVFSQSPPYFQSVDSAMWYAFSVNSAYDSDSITIILYPGTHLVHHMIGWDSVGIQLPQTEHRTPRDYITIIGFGNNSVLECDSTTGGNFMFSNLYFSGGSHLTLRNFAINLRGDKYLTAKPWGMEIHYVDHVIIDNVKIYNGGNIQGKGCIGIYHCPNQTINDCDFIDVDCQVYSAGRKNKNIIITNNRSKGGKSEGIWVGSSSGSGDYTADDYYYPTDVVNILISGNICEDKATSNIKLAGFLNANAVISNNIINRTHETAYSTHSSTGITINHCRGVTVADNMFNGNTKGTFLTIINSENIIVTGNIGNNLGSVGFALEAGADIGVYSTGGTVKNKNLIIKNNIFNGLRNAPIWNIIRTWRVGEIVGDGNQDYTYICKVENTNIVQTNTTYWTKLTAWDYPLIRLFGDHITFEYNQITGHHREAIWVDSGGMQSLHINNNTIKNCTKGIIIDLNESGYGPMNIGGGYDFDDLQINNNYVSTNDSGGSDYSLRIDGVRKITNSEINGNTFKAEVAANPSNRLLYTWVENLRIMDNNFGGNAAGQNALREYYAVAKKSGNVLLNDGTLGTLNSGAINADTAIGGWINKGERFDVSQPSTILGYICTTAGYAWRETYNVASTYQVGEHVLGSDNKVYTCILYDTGETTNVPITGGNYATYWVLAGGVGTPLAVIKAISF